MKYNSKKEAEKAAVQLIADYLWSHDSESRLIPLSDEEHLIRAKEINEALEYYKD